MKRKRKRDELFFKFVNFLKNTNKINNEENPRLKDETQFSVKNNLNINKGNTININYKSKSRSRNRSRSKSRSTNEINDFKNGPKWMKETTLKIKIW